MLLLLTFVLSACGAAPTAQNWPGLTVADGVVYVITGTPQRVYLVDAETGVQRSSFLPAGEHNTLAWWSPVAVGGGLAYVGFSEPQAKPKSYGLYAFDPETGQQRWQIQINDLLLASPVYDQGIVYAGVSDGSVYAVEGETGIIQPGWPFEAGEAIWASPLVADGRVYVASMDHHLYCLDAATGALEWSFEAGGALAAQPILQDGILYFGAFDGRVYALHADSGQAVDGFEFRAENWIWSEILPAGDQLYVSSLDGNLYALDPSSGQVIPPYPYKADSPLRAAPVQAGETIIAASESGRVAVMRAENAQVLWSWLDDAPEVSILTTPVFWQDTIYVVAVDGKVQTLDAETGVQGWAFAPPASE